jgi:hypothetical protein
VDVNTSGANSVAVRINKPAATNGPVTGMSIDASGSAMGNAIAINNVSSSANGLAVSLNPNGGAGVSNTNSVTVDMTNGNGGGNIGYRVASLSHATDHGVDIAMSAGTGINETMTANGTALQVNSIAGAQGLNLLGTSSGTGISIQGPSGTGFGINITGNAGTGISVGGPNGSGYNAVGPSTLNVTSGQIRSSAGLQTNPATASGQFAGRVHYDHTQPRITVFNSLAQGDVAAGDGSGSTIICTLDLEGQTDNSYSVSVKSVTNGSFIVTSSDNAFDGYINYIIINH